MNKVRPTAVLPVSPNCPKCESEEFKRVRSNSQLAIQDDRICKKCGQALPTKK